MELSTVKNPEKYVVPEVLVEIFGLPVLAAWLLLEGGGPPFELQLWHKVLFLVLCVPAWVYRILGKARALMILRPFAPAQLTFSRNEFEVTTKDGVATHAWQDVDSVKTIAGSDVTVLRNKHGQALFAFDGRSSDTTKFSAWLKVFPKSQKAERAQQQST